MSYENPKPTMPKELKTKWIEALRSGDYAQTTSYLKVGEEEAERLGCAAGYCCLGVLEEVAEGQVEERVGETTRYELFPSREFWQRNKIYLSVVRGSSTFSADLAALNDRGIDFLTIADKIEAEVEGV